MRRRPDGVELRHADGEPGRFDHVVVATHSDQALAVVRPRAGREEVLGAIRYQPNLASCTPTPA